MKLWALSLAAFALAATSCSTPAESGPGDPQPGDGVGGSAAGGPPPATGTAASPSRRFSPALAREGVPLPGGPVPACHERRRGAEAPFELLPAAIDSLFLSCQVVAYYGYPDVPGMGALGSASPDEIAGRVRDMADSYDAVNGSRMTVGAFHIVAAVAQGSPKSDGTWLAPDPGCDVGALAPGCPET